MKKLHKVHRLPTEDKTDLGLLDNKILGYIPNMQFNRDWEFVVKNWKRQHLYFTSDEAPKDGDFVLLKYPSGYEVKQMVSGVAYENAECINNENKFHNCGHRKIVATTDKSLFVWEQCNDCSNIGTHMGCNLCKKVNLPQISKYGMLIKYIKLSNALIVSLICK